MNYTVYLFGNENRGNDSLYFQYPNDYASDIFRRFEGQLQDDTLLALHRNESLAYHVYMKRVGNGYIGLCALFNGVWVNNSKSLLKVFNDTFVDIVAQGLFVEVSDQGKLMSKASQMTNHTQEAEDICRQLSYRLAGLEQFCKLLPPLNVSVEANVSMRLANQASDKEWKQGLDDYRSMYANYSSSETGGRFYLLLEKIASLSTERDSLMHHNAELVDKCNQIEKQQKQYKIVILLVSLLLVGGIITAYIVSEKNGNINELKEEVSSLDSKVKKLNSEIQEKTIDLEYMTENKNRLEETVRQKNNEIDQLKTRTEIIGQSYPMIINKIEIGNIYKDNTLETPYGSTIYSSNSMYLQPKIYYTCISSGRYNLKVKLFTPDGSISKGDSSPSGFTYSGSYYVYSGEDSMVLAGWGGSTKGHWKSGTYRFEVWYEDVCLKTKTFTVY